MAGPQLGPSHNSPSFGPGKAAKDTQQKGPHIIGLLSKAIK